MSRKSARSSQADLVTEASAWFIEFRAGDASASDRGRFYEWLNRSPEHIQAYLEIAEGWAELPTSDPQGRLDLGALIERARENRDDNVIALVSLHVVQTQRHRSKRRTRWAALAAGIVMAIGLAAWLLLYQGDTYDTGVGEQRMVRLADGSTVELNARSKVRVRYSRDERAVELLEGQALFQVAKDHARPFVVSSGTTQIRAVGTQFDVYRRRQGTVVTVVEGRVAVADENLILPVREIETGVAEPMFLVAGEQMAVPTQTVAKPIALEPKRADVVAATAWVHKQLIFNDTPLSEVAEEFNRYSTRRLVIADPALVSMEVSGVYSSTQPDSVLGFLRAQPNIQLNETDTEIQVALSLEK